MSDTGKVEATSRLKTAISSLERKYRFAVEQSDKKNFFLGAADYVKTIEESAILHPLIKITVIDERDKVRAEQDRLGELLRKFMTKSIKSLLIGYKCLRLNLQSIGRLILTTKQPLQQLYR